MAALLTALLLIPLTIIGISLVSNAQENRLINNLIETEFSEIRNAELVELTIFRSEGEIELDITVRSNSPLTYNQVVSLQEILVARLDKPVSLKVDHIRSETFDPMVPPTQTPSPTITSTPTLGPSPTNTPTSTQTSPPPTQTPFPATSTPTATITPTRATPTPIAVIVISAGEFPPYYYLYQEPGGPEIARLAEYAVLLDLHESMTYEGLIWVKVQDKEGRIGWYPKRNLVYPTEISINN